VTVQGYVDTVEVHVALSADGARVRGIRIGSHRETAGYGARIETASFLNRFVDVTLPVSLAGEASALKDGTYRVVADKADDSGFRDVVELTVRDGILTAVNWDAVGLDGVGKKELSRGGNYVMTPDGLPWHEQAQLLEQALLRTQDPTAIVYDAETGKTDAYSGASIRVDPFVKLAKQAFAKAAGDSRNGTVIDGLSGATASSKAVVAAVNTASQFIRGKGET
jgi:major membrane immunogen (membrane-anchored lipoprotein)